MSLTINANIHTLYECTKCWCVLLLKRVFNALPLKIRARVAAVFERLTHWPAVSGYKALRGSRRTEYRIRTGDYRILFTVDTDIEVVSIIKIGNRKDVYED